MWYPSVMRILLLPLLALCLQVPAKADKFWLSDPAAEKSAVEGSLPNLVEGVLIAESDEGYHIRVVGGEILLPKKSVFRIEKDDLSIETIEKREQQAAEQRAASERAASETAPKAVPASARRHKPTVAAADAASKRSDAAAPPAPAPAPITPTESGFDPVIGREIAPKDGLSQADLMAELQLAWTMTKDKRYLVALRQLRRMR
jgi:hypothetical protein